MIAPGLDALTLERLRRVGYCVVTSIDAAARLGGRRKNDARP